MCYPSVQSFFFTSGGAESNESAFKTARYFWKVQGFPEKTKIISRHSAYHGTTLAAMSATGLQSYWPMFEPRVAGFLHIAPPYSYWQDSLIPHIDGDKSLSFGIRAANELEKIILHEGPDTVAAFIAEPVQGAGGVIVPPDDYFPRIREICDRYNLLFIADEVITGFGRTGRLFGLEHWSVSPDILTFAKAITSGYIPLGGMGVNGRVADAIRSGSGSSKWMHAYTYSGHPTACAVAIANLDIVEREGLVARAGDLGSKLLAGLKPLESHPHVGEVRGMGLMAAVELVESKSPQKRFDAAQGVGARVLAEMARRGVITRIVGDVILLAPPAVMTAVQIDRVARVVGDSVFDLFSRGVAATS
jgi:adenosylmethionine-8-amino-7-oxononanoate aminotransferase